MNGDNLSSIVSGLNLSIAGQRGAVGQNLINNESPMSNSGLLSACMFINSLVVLVRALPCLKSNGHK